jgi:alpha-ketoglutarate-dependent taurine dioxygenase
MTPADERAHDAVRHFESLTSSAYRHQWTAPGQVLVISNRRALHARAAVVEVDRDRELTRIAYRVPPKR